VVQIHRGGWIGLWSWEQLAMQLVVKSGVLSIVTMVIDTYWQFVLPLFGRNYNDRVYRLVGGMQNAHGLKND
jgi:hypothetical protein